MTSKNTSPTYYPEIDIMRGLTVVAMIIFHACIQLKFIFQKYVITNTWFWKHTPIFIGGSFLMLVGVSLYIGQKRGKYNTMQSLLKRSGFIFGLGMAFTGITLIGQQGFYVYFGILHCIGLSTLISYYTLPWPAYVNLLAGIIILGLGMPQKLLLFPSCYNVWTFFLWPSSSPLFKHADYYPIIPAIGFVFIGIFVGKVLYTNGQRTFNLPIPKHVLTYTAPIRWLGRHALLIYCIHIPIIFVLLYIMSYLQHL